MVKRKRTLRSTLRGNKAKRPLKLDTTFECMACLQGGSVRCKLDYDRKVGRLYCTGCCITYHCAIDDLSHAVDVYAEWIDDCEALNKSGVQRAKQQPGDTAIKRMGPPLEKPKSTGKATKAAKVIKATTVSVKDKGKCRPQDPIGTFSSGTNNDMHYEGILDAHTGPDAEPSLFHDRPKPTESTHADTAKNPRLARKKPWEVGKMKSVEFDKTDHQQQQTHRNVQDRHRVPVRSRKVEGDRGSSASQRVAQQEVSDRDRDREHDLNYSKRASARGDAEEDEEEETPVRRRRL